MGNEPSDAPSTPEEWRLEWLVLVERMRQEPASWQSQRWPLHEWDYVPPTEFIRDLLAGWYLASNVYEGLDARSRAIEDEGGPVFRPEAHPEFRRAIRTIDASVSIERSRRLRDRLAAEDEAAPPGGPMTDHAREVLATLPAVIVGLKGRRITKMSVSTGLGVDRNTLNTWIRKRWMVWPPSS